MDFLLPLQIRLFHPLLDPLAVLHFRRRIRHRLHLRLRERHLRKSHERRP